MTIPADAGGFEPRRKAEGAEDTEKAKAETTVFTADRSQGRQDSQIKRINHHGWLDRGHPQLKMKITGSRRSTAVIFRVKAEAKAGEHAGSPLRQQTG